MNVGPLGRWWARRSEATDQRRGWQSRLPLLGALRLSGLRTVLRQRNLTDTDQLPRREPSPELPPQAPRWRMARSADGTYNDLDFPAMGSSGARFGRNVPAEQTVVDRDRLLRPSPRVVSLRLMTREEFIPAPSLNLLAASWLQFMVHDWLQHGKNQSHDPWVVLLADDDPWPDHPMKIQRTRHDPTRPEGGGGPPSFANTVTHWWDGSHIYGSDEATQRRLRSGQDGKLRIGDDGLLPVDSGNHHDVTAVTANYWLGLSLLHTLFTPRAQRHLRGPAPDPSLDGRR